MPDRKLIDKDEIYVIPFGRYEAEGDAPHPANEALVGRQAQRAKLLTHLFANSSRGAYLITGYRGSGKTSFVNYCLRELQENIFQRYLQRNIGRKLVFDRLGLGLLAGILVATGVLMSQALAILLQSRQNLWIILAEALIAILLSYPLFAAQRNLWGALGEITGTHLIQAALLAFFVTIALFILPLASPADSLARIITSFLVYVILVHFLSIYSMGLHDQQVAPTESFAETIKRPSTEQVWTRVFTIRSHLLPLIGAVAFFLIPHTMQLQTYFLIGLITLFLFSLTRGCLELLSARSEFLSWPNRRGTKVAAEGSSRLYFTLTLVSLAGVTILNQRPLLSLALLALAMLLIWRLKRSSRSSHGKIPRFAPSPLALLVIKSFLLTILAIQLLAPLLQRTYSALSQLPGLTESLVRYASDLAGPESLVAAWERSSHQSITVFSLYELGGSVLNQELLWILAVTTLLMLIYFLEYEWIVRPYASIRQDQAFVERIHTPSSSSTSKHAGSQHWSKRQVHRDAFDATFFAQVHSVWLPILTVPVNLGFDILDQRLVIEAMLVGLRRRVRQTFLNWRNPFVATRRLLGLLTLLLLSIHLGNSWFYAPDLNAVSRWEASTLKFCTDTPRITEPSHSASVPLWLACRFGGLTALRFLYWTPLPVDDFSIDNTTPHSILTAALASGMEGKPLQQPASALYSLRMYHLLIFGLGLVISGFLRRWLNPLPYRDIENRITHVLDGLSSTLKEELRPDRVTSWFSALTGGERVRSKESSHFDPRTVELQLLSILSDLHDSQLQIPFTRSHRISFPAPEVVFLFDELDKIEAAYDPAATEPGPTSDEPLNEERVRSRALHSLFADLKNVISSEHARFIFIGGRNLHDEWLADSTARRPLLTNIFTAEIYVPSLFADEVGQSQNDRTEILANERVPGIEAFLRRQLFRAQQLFEVAKLRSIRLGITLQHESHLPATYVQEGFEDNNLSTWPKLEVYSSRLPEEVHDPEQYTLPPVIRSERQRFRQSFTEFLTYRSKGNIKRLRELLGDLMEPAGRVVIERSGKVDDGLPIRIRLQTQFDCDHALVFGDIDRFRVYLISDLYRSLWPGLVLRLQAQDDKMPQAMLYLADFLLKFHRRAFSWSNIERVDELVHIHRAPDLRQTMRYILSEWEDRYIHSIRNGMYDYRFVSEYGREIEYLSRLNDDELAAFNFTLDESYFLKRIYQSRCSVYGDESSVEFTTALAELHKFDGEYEVARQYLRKAIRLLDRNIEESIGGSPFRQSSVQDVIQGTAGGLAIVQSHLHYPVNRIRTMLQIGMTFERSRDFERALVAYRDARTLSESALSALIGDPREGRGKKGASDPAGYLAAAKKLNIFFQPLFAEGWLAEKSPGTVDPGPAIVESGLWKLRLKLPFVSPDDFRRTKPYKLSDRRLVKHSSFALLFAELEDKAGDIYFFKGGQLLSEDQLRRISECSRRNTKPKAIEGYLIAAHYHYALSIHEIRRFNHYRISTSGQKFSLDREPTLVSNLWPDFVQRVAAASLADLADSFLARLCFTQLLVECGSNPTIAEVSNPTSSRSIEAAFDELVAWIESGNKGIKRIRFTRKGPWTDSLNEIFPHCPTPHTSLRECLGVVSSKNSNQGWLLRAPLEDSEASRLCNSLMFLLSSARLLRKSGHGNAALREYLRVAEAVATVKWWLRVFTWVQGKDKPEAIAASLNKLQTGAHEARPLLEDLQKLAVVALRNINRLSQASGVSEPQKLPDRLPLIAPFIAASLALSTSDNPDSLVTTTALATMGEQPGKFPDNPASNLERITKSLRFFIQYRPYPTLGRLYGMKTVIDHTLLTDQPPSFDLDDLVDRFILIENQYQSPLHFTPLASGITLALYSLHLENSRQQDGRGPSQRIQQIRRDAIRRLYRSQQVHTLRRSFNSHFAGLYYLYDDFNDRAIHFQHALQMAGSDIASMLIRFLEARESRETGTTYDELPR